jgi:glutaminase
MLCNKLLSKTFTWTALLTSLISIPATAQSVSPVAPQAAQLKAAVNSAYSMFRGDTSGKNADYIPYLAQVNSKLFGIAVVTTDDQVYTVGDISYSFSMQSISKVFTLAMAIEQLGADTVFDRIGNEPTGRPFNSVDAVVDMPTHTGNALVNAGAIATTGLIGGASANERWGSILAYYGKAAGEKLKLIDEVYRSEAATNQGNRALAALLVKYDRIHSDPLEAVDIYTKQCSVGVNVKQLAEMGATLANNGINPATHEKVMKATNVPFILAAMTMAGLYDGSGGWAWHVGLPAKSGVGGAILAIVPGKGAIAVFAPPLDDKGNSVKAQKVITYVSQKLHYNLFSPKSVGLGVNRPRGGGE